jgi:hypothetical protein
MTASRLLDDIQKQADVTAYLLELLDDEALIEDSAHYGASTESPILQRWKAIDTYRDLLKQRLREAK